MATSKTTLAGPVDASPAHPGDDLVIQVASATGFATSSITPQLMILIDSEFLVQTAAANGTAIPVARGKEGTAAARHNLNAEVIVGLPSDFTSAPAGTGVTLPPSPVERRKTYGTAGAIDLPGVQEHVYVELVTGTAGAFTLADPTDAIEGAEMTIVARDAFAYTCTNSPTGFNGGGAGSDVATFGGAIGDNFRIRAQNRVWNILYHTNVTAA